MVQVREGFDLVSEVSGGCCYASNISSSMSVFSLARRDAGRTLAVGDLARIYGFTDADGR